MFYAWIDGNYRQPLTTGERTICNCCDGELQAVVPHDNHAHWRHKSGNCDSWSEPEGEWHLGWKMKFPLHSREVLMIDPLTQEHHRADVFHRLPGCPGTTIELQHSQISEKERDAREVFYSARGRMFWLVHIHDETNFNATSFRCSFSMKLPFQHGKSTFYSMSWYGRSKQFIEKWKRSRAHVFFNIDGRVFYLATMLACPSVVKGQRQGEFALCEVSEEQFLRSAGA